MLFKDLRTVLPFVSHNNRNIYKPAILEIPVMADDKIHQNYHVYKVMEINPEKRCSCTYEAEGPIGSELSGRKGAKTLSGLAGIVIDDHVKYLAQNDMAYKGPELSPLGNLQMQVISKTPFDILVDGDVVYEARELSAREKRQFAEGLHARNSLYWNSDFDDIEEFIRNLPKP